MNRREKEMIEVRGSGLGTEVWGLGSCPVEEINAQELRDLIYKNKLLILKDFRPDLDTFLSLGQALGTVVPYYEPLYHHPEHPEIFVSSNDETTGGVPKTGAFWHIDYQFMPEPFAFTMTMPVAVPGKDRGTYFIDLAQIWKELPEALKAEVRGTKTVSSPRRYVKIRPQDVYRPIGEILEEIESTTPPQYWPTVIQHPITGEEILYICEAFAEKIIDSQGEGKPASLLEELLTVSHQRQELDQDIVPGIHTQLFNVGDVLLWDNRSLAHRAKHGQTPGIITTYRLTMLDSHPLPGTAV